MSLMLRSGSNGTDVRKLQAVLNHLHSATPALQIDGLFGPKTQAAVVQFQKAVRVTPDGIVGPITSKALLGVVHGTLVARRPFSSLSGT